MEQEAHNLVMATYIIGGAVISLLLFVAATAWKIKGGLDRRDSEVKTLQDGQATIESNQNKHEVECQDFRREVKAEFRRGSDRFKELHDAIVDNKSELKDEIGAINASLGFIEGHLGVDRNKK